MADKRDLKDTDLSKVSGAGRRTFDLAPNATMSGRGKPQLDREVAPDIEPIDDPESDADTTTGNDSGNTNDFDR